ncbi:MAG: beta-lactamase family protein [Betaproteobacteria bacterium]|nr:beta-lactamase family protein [Betaproteobacteria bacterium]
MNSYDPVTAGMDPAVVGRLSRAIERDLAAGRCDGIAIRVARRGIVAVDAVFGFAERATGTAIDQGSVFSVMSLTKPMTAVAIFRAIERGDLALNTPVCAIIPEFGILGKHRITIAQLLSHTGGMPFLLPNLPADRIGDLASTVAAICAISPVNRPGESVSYSARISYDMLGEVIRRLDGPDSRYRDVIARDILAPLGMTRTAIGLRNDLAPYRVPVVARNPTEMNRQLESRDRTVTAETELPGGGAFSTLADMHRFAEMLRLGGTLDGAAIVSPASLRLATRNHTGMMPNNTLAAQMEMRGWDTYPAYLGLGFFLRGEGVYFPAPFGTLASPSTFGGIGAGSTVFWVDPKSEISFVCLTSGLMDQIDSHLRFQKLSDIVHGSITE